MLTQFRAHDSKNLYFKINNSLLMSDPEVTSPTYKIPGLYAIYKEKICLYVGQSMNLASRISTHLTGRYEDCDEIHIYYVPEYWGNFFDAPSDERKAILELNETYLINILKPTENLIVDRDAEIPDRLLFDNLIDGPRPPYMDVSVSVEKDLNICVTDDLYHCMHELHKNIHESYRDLIKNTQLVAK